MKKILMIITLVSLLVCCSTQKTARETIIHDTIYSKSIEKVLDSVFVDRYNVTKEKGDTIFVLDSVSVTRWRDRYLTDTFIQKNDSIVYENSIEEIHIVPTYYKVMHWIAWILIILLLIRVAIFIIKLYMRR